ncbi:MAG: class I SAM-dependent methyltransferase [Candidatus Coatesbacteria bacterium]|nr:class I SAM-dependent methyltransferase [Candidatus Coatesbacteria bacterium]
MGRAPSFRTPAVSLEKGSCCLCGGEDGQIVVQSSGKALGTTSAKFAFVRCPQCRVLFLDPRPTADSLELLYPDDEYYSRDIEKLSDAASKSSDGLKQRLQSRIIRAYGLLEKEKGEGRKEKGRRLWDSIGRATVFPLLVRQSALLRTLIHNRRFLRFNRRPARILEVGFGNGLLLFALSHLDAVLFGTEVSQKACDAVASCLGIEAFCGQLWDAGFADGQFDLVIFSHSLEHIAEPVRALHEARRIVSPNGALLISVPNPDCLSARVFREHWAGYDFPRHLFLFGRDALSEMADEAGFRLQEVRFPLEGGVHHLAESINSRLGLRVIPDVLAKTLLTQIPYLPIILSKSGDVMAAYLFPV